MYIGWFDFGFVYFMDSYVWDFELCDIGMKTVI